jgi:hypothetical protein
VAKSKKGKTAKAKANRSKKGQRKPTRPLPKVGTPASNRYAQEHARNDVVDFGLTQRKRGKANVIIAVLIIAVMLLALFGFLFLTKA